MISTSSSNDSNSAETDAALEAGPDTRSDLRAWLAVLSVALGSFVVVTSEFLPIGLLTDISAGLQITAGTAGLMVTIPGIVAAIAAPVMAVTAGRFDRRTIVLGLIALLVLSNATSALAPNFSVMLAGRVMFGICLGGFWTIAVTLGARLVAKEALSRATTIILAGITFATVIGVPAGAYFASIAGWRAAFFVVGAVALLIFLAQLFLLPSLPARQQLSWGELTHLLRNRDARIGLASVALVISGHFAAYTYVAPFLKHVAHIDAKLLSSLLLTYGVAGIVGNFVGGWAAARSLRLSLGAVVAMLSAAILLLPVAGVHAAGAAVLLGLWGFAFGAVPIVLQLWVFRSAPEALEGGAALLVTTFQVFIALGSVGGGVIVDALGTPAVMWTSGIVTLATLALVAWPARRVARVEPVDAGLVGAGEILNCE